MLRKREIDSRRVPSHHDRVLPKMESETKTRNPGSLELPRREPSIRKGRTIAVVLQQAYFKNDDDDNDDSTSGDNGKPDYNRLADATTSPPPHNNTLSSCARSRACSAIASWSRSCEIMELSLKCASFRNSIISAIEFILQQHVDESVAKHQ